MNYHHRHIIFGTALQGKINQSLRTIIAVFGIQDICDLPLIHLSDQAVAAQQINVTATGFKGNGIDQQFRMRTQCPGDDVFGTRFRKLPRCNYALS